jgi:hypothetical protein
MSFQLTRGMAACEDMAGTNILSFSGEEYRAGCGSVRGQSGRDDAN